LARFQMKSERLERHLDYSAQKLYEQNRARADPTKLEKGKKVIMTYAKAFICTTEKRYYDERIGK